MDEHGDFPHGTGYRQVTLRFPPTGCEKRVFVWSIDSTAYRGAWETQWRWKVTRAFSELGQLGKS